LIHFLDTSALAKRYVTEPGSQEVRALFRRGVVAAARITQAELLAALARAWRLGVITEAQRATTFQRVAEDFAAFTIIEIRPMMLQRVAELVVRHPLRGYDAVQLAAALAVRDHGGSVRFWSADRQLVAAALAEGLGARVPGS
jgi:predicted nucleic acid-binding protein